MTTKKLFMQSEYYYRVAGLVFCVCVPQELDIELLLPSFSTFRCYQCGEEELLFKLVSAPGSFQPMETPAVLEEATNEWGSTLIARAADGFQIECQCGKSGGKHYLKTNALFTLATAYINWEERYAGEVLGLLLRLVYSQAVLSHGGIALHASVVVSHGKGYLFMGKSGTGKSTHAALWVEHFNGCELLNDDNPVVRIEQGCVAVYGTPWSGKTPCYRNMVFPVGGIVRLVQAPYNRFTRKKEIGAFVTVLPGCAVFPQDPPLHEKLCNLLVTITGLVPVGVMECLPDKEAAEICKSGISA